MSNKSQALQQISLLMSQHDISLDDIRARVQDAKPDKSSHLSKLFYYIGGIFIFAALGVFSASFWEEIGFGGQVTITLGLGFFIFLMGIAATKEKKFEKLSTPLFLIAAALQPAGIMLVLAEYSTAPNPPLGVFFTSMVMLCQSVPVFWATRRTVLLFISLLFFGGAFTSSVDLFDILDGNLEWFGIVMGLSYVMISSALRNTDHDAITPFWFFVGSAMILTGAFDVLENTVFEILYLGLATSIVYFSTRLSSRILLFNGTIALLTYIGYFAAEHFEDSLGFPFVLLIIGVSCMGLGTIAVRLGRKMNGKS